MNSLRKKISSLTIQSILLASSATIVVVFMVVGAILDTFMSMTDQRAQRLVREIEMNAKSNEEHISRLINETMLSKARNLVEHDVSTLRQPFLENSVSFIRNFVIESYRLDKDLLQVSFFSIEGEAIKAWQIASRQFSSGTDPRARYDGEQAAWIIPQMQGPTVTIPDPAVPDLIQNERYSVREIIFQGEGASGQRQSIRALEALAPIFDQSSGSFAEIRARGEAIGFIRYVISLEKMDAIIALQQADLGKDLLETQRENEQAKAAIESMGRWYTFLAFFIILSTTALVLFYAIRNSRKKAALISEPVGQLTAMARIISQGNYDEPVQLNSDDEIGVLAETFEEMRRKIRDFTNNLQDLVDQRTADLNQVLKQITFEKAKIQEIMDNIELGIVTIDENLGIDSQYSRHMEQLFQADKLDRASFENLVIAPMQLDDNCKNIIVETLKMGMGQTCFSFMANASHLPSRADFAIGFQKEPRTFSLDWKPMIQDDTVARIMVVIKDITLELAMQRQIAAVKAQNHELTQIVLEVIRAPRERVAAFLRKFQESMAHIQLHLQSDQLNSVLIDLHTFKGAARTLRLDQVAGRVHQVESEIKQGKDRSSNENLEEKFKEFVQWFHSYFELACKILGLDADANVSQHENFTDTNLFAFMTHCLPLLKEHAGQAQLRLGRLVIDDQILQWPQSILEKIKDVLIHALNNSIDHGYVLPIKSGKEKRDIHIEIRSFIENQQLKIEVSDFGFGPDIDRIRLCIREKGLPAHLEDTPLAALFVEGFSTSSEATMTSGRGVGLSFMHRFVKDLSGTIELQSGRNGVGMQLAIAIPYAAFGEKGFLERAG